MRAQTHVLIITITLPSTSNYRLKDDYNANEQYSITNKKKLHLVQTKFLSKKWHIYGNKKRIPSTLLRF